MKHGYIIFWDAEEKPIKISEYEYGEIMKVWKIVDHVVVQGRVEHKRAIKRIKPPEKLEPLRLIEPQGKPVSKEFMEEIRQRINKKILTK